MAKVNFPPTTMETLNDWPLSHVSVITFRECTLFIEVLCYKSFQVFVTVLIIC